MKYGARGITVCAEWLDFNVFEVWVNNSGYSYELSIDRIDNNGNYEPSNCKWSTPTEQANNRRSNVFLEFNNKRQTIAEWSREVGLSQGCIGSRIKYGWSVKRALTQPTRLL